MRSHEDCSRVSQLALSDAEPVPRANPPSPPQSFQDVLEALGRIDSLTKVQRGRHQSNVRRLARLLCGSANRLADMSADPGSLQDGFDRALDAAPNPQGRKKASRLIAAARLALRAAGVSVRDGHGRMPCSAGWIGLAHRLNIRDWERTAFVNFAAWCTEQEIEAEAVDQATFDRYEVGHGQTHGRARDQKSGRQQFLALVKVWKEHVRAKGLGGVEQIKCAGLTDRYCFQVEKWPESFRQEVKGWAEYAQHCNPRDPHSPKPVGAASAAHEVQLIYAMASAYCRQTGLCPTSLRSMSTFVNAQGARAIFAFMFDRADRFASVQRVRTDGIYQSACLLVKLGRYGVRLPSPQLEALVNLRKQLGPSASRRDKKIPLSERRGRVISAFSEERLVKELRNLPSVIYEDLPFDQPLTYSEVVKFSTAFALSFLWSTCAAPRVLVSAKLSDFVYDVEPGGPVVFLRQEAASAAVTRLEFEGERGRLFRLYVGRVRPLHPACSTPYLLPGAEGPCNAGWLSKKIAALTQEYLAVRITASEVVCAKTMAAALKLSAEAAVGLVRSSLRQKRARVHDAELVQIKLQLAARHVDQLLDNAPGA